MKTNHSAHGDRRARWAVAACAVALGAVLAPIAHGGKPFREQVPLGSSGEMLPGEACPVSIAPKGVGLEVIGGNHALSFFDDGRFLVTGRHVDRVTNIATGASVVLELGGSVMDRPLDDGTTHGRASGTLGFVFLPGDAGPGDTHTGRFYVFTGTFRYVYDSTYTVTEFESVGTMQDVCALLD
jgi:hypothetical protein